MYDWILTIICTYIIIKLIIDFINKRTYIKIEVDNSIRKNGNIYINLYDYKSKEILSRAIVETKGTDLFEEFKLNKNLILSLNYKEKLKHRYFKF